MTPPTMAASEGDQLDQLALIEEQRRHLCTDCGYTYLTGSSNADGPAFSRRVIGGGTIVSSDGPIREVHILPHCGTELPGDLLSDLHPDQLPQLSKLIHDNADIGTGAIYRALLEDATSGRSQGVIVAAFHLSRLLLDANRANAEEQVPPKPYVGSADIYADYLARRGQELREELLLPWLDAVNEILREVGERGVVYHHHTYDLQSMSPRPFDFGSPQRPAFQLVWQKPTWGFVNTDGAPSHEDGLVPLHEIQEVRKRISAFLQVEMGLTDGEGAIDYPMLLPVVPFSGTRKEDPPGMPHHVMYDLRKDILITDEHVRSWVLRSPWRLAYNG